jgi:hypothetical protein
MSADRARALAEAVARYAPAEDVTDLDTARRLITALREKIARMAEEAEPIVGEWTAFLDEEHDRKLQLLYETKRLIGDPQSRYWLDPPELAEAFTDFVEGWLDIAWDVARDDQELGRASGPRRSITPSA